MGRCIQHRRSERDETKNTTREQADITKNNKILILAIQAFGILGKDIIFNESNRHRPALRQPPLMEYIYI
jgi:hypothetical protein